jgi:hypothetical protein
MSLDYGFAWMMVLLRSIGLIIQLPVIAGRPIPIPVRIALGACLATLLAGIVPGATAPVGAWGLASAVIMEILLGLAPADLFEIQGCDFLTIVFQPRRGRRDQARFADSIGRNDVGIAAGADCLVQYGVGGALNIARTNCMQWRTDAEELAGCVKFCAFAASSLFVRTIAHRLFRVPVSRYSHRFAALLPATDSV